jgi:hypothetical protein
VLPVRHHQAISASHPLPIIFVGSSTNETDLIVLAIATEPWPVNRWEQNSPKSRCKNLMSVARFRAEGETRSRDLF